MIQVHVTSLSWGFESPLEHYFKACNPPSLAGFFVGIFGVYWRGLLRGRGFEGVLLRWEFVIFRMPRDLFVLRAIYKLQIVKRLS